VGIVVPEFHFVDHFVRLPFQKGDAIPLVKIVYTVCSQCLRSFVCGNILVEEEVLGHI
jgi:hypothetical protein